MPFNFSPLCASHVHPTCIFFLEKPHGKLLSITFGKAGTATKRTGSLKKFKNSSNMLRILDFLFSYRKGRKYGARCKYSERTMDKNKKFVDKATLIAVLHKALFLKCMFGKKTTQANANMFTPGTDVKNL